MTGTPNLPEARRVSWRGQVVRLVSGAIATGLIRLAFPDIGWRSMWLLLAIVVGIVGYELANKEDEFEATASDERGAQ